MKDQIARFWARVDKRGPTECWEWTGGRRPHGYGQVFFNGKNMRTHRLSWVLNCGAIPADMNVCHRCDNPPCVNPDHLYLGTQKQNIREAQSKGRLYNHYRNKTHCSSGHLLSDDNTDMIKDGKGFFYRRCRTCYKAKARAYREKKMEKLLAAKRSNGEQQS